MAAEEKAAKIQPNVSPLRAAKAMNHIVAATSDSLSMREERYPYNTYFNQTCHK